MACTSPRAYARLPGASQTVRRFPRECQSPLAGRPERGETAVRLLEVVADELVQIFIPAVEPTGEALVQFGAELLRDALVHGIADQDVPEAESVLDQLVRANQLFADERGELRTGRSAPVGSQFPERFPFELESRDRGPLEYVSLLVRE